MDKETEIPSTSSERGTDLGTRGKNNNNTISRNESNIPPPTTGNNSLSLDKGNNMEDGTNERSIPESTTGPVRTSVEPIPATSKSDEGVDTTDIPTHPTSSRPQRQHVRRRTTSTDSSASGALSLSMSARSSGSLATDLLVAEKHMNENHCATSEVRDPILDAVAAGAAVRQSKLLRQQQLQKQLQQQKQHGTSMNHRRTERGNGTLLESNHKKKQHQISTKNDWKLSLGRLAKAAMSTAKTAVHVTTPLLDEARHTVVSSATGFAHDVQEEWQKQQEQEEAQQKQKQRQDHEQEQEQAQQKSIDDVPPPPIVEQDTTVEGSTENIDETTNAIDSFGDMEKSSGDDLRMEGNETDAPPTDTQPIQTKTDNDKCTEPEQQEAGQQVATIETMTKTTEETSVQNPISATSNNPLAETSENEVERNTIGPLDESKLQNEGNASHSVDKVDGFVASVTEDPPNLANGDTMNTEKADEDPINETSTEQQQEDALLLVGDTSTPATISDDTTENHSVENKQAEENNNQYLKLDTGNPGITIDTVRDKAVKSEDTSKSATENSTVDPKVESLNGILLADRNLSTDTDEGIDPAIRALFESTGAALDAATAEIVLNDDHGQVNGESNYISVADTAIVDESQNSDIAAGPVEVDIAAEPLEVDHTSIDVTANSNLSQVNETDGDKLTTDDVVIDVGSLAIYEDGVPESFTQATQAVRNYHANVQTLEKCETKEQKETCRLICDETYKLACQMVAQQNDMESPESEKYQMGLLDDLRKLRELQKTTFAVEEESSNFADLDADVEEQAKSHGVPTAKANDIQVPEAPKEAQDVGIYESTTDAKSGSSAGDVRVQDNETLVISTSDASAQDSNINESNDQILESIRDKPKDVTHIEQSSKIVDDDDEAVVKTQASPAPTTSALFSESGDGIYEQSAGTTAPTAIAEESNSQKERPETAFSVVKDRKTFVKYIVSSLTGFDVEIKDRTPEAQLTDPSSIRYSSMPTSIFDNLNDNADETSSIASPPEVELSVQDDTQSAYDEISKDESAGIDSTFDLVPPRHEITKYEYVPEVLDVPESNEVEDEKTVENDAEMKILPLKKQRSFTSLHNSTENNSAPSLSPRRKTKRFGKTLNSRSGFNKSPRLTPKMPLSPLDTPVESRSIGVEDDQLHASLSNSSVGLGRVIVDWDADAMNNHPSVPDTEEMTDALDRQGLDETLLGFSSLDDGNFLTKLSKCGPQDSNTAASSSLLWKQLLANWKHREAWKSASNHPFLPFSSSAANASRPLFEENDESTSGKTINFQIHDKMVSFSSGVMSDLVPPLISDMCRQVESSDQLGLTRFLCDIGPDDVCSPKSNHMLRHTESAIFERKASESSNISSSLIRQSARRELPRFTNLVESIVRYASLNESQSDFELYHIAFTTGIKDIHSIDEKSKRKYDGDLLQVKDVLRGQIIFPDENSLLCGLYQLHQHSKASNSTNENDLSLEIVRLKNMFQTTGAGNDTNLPLPTGYRHILINIRLESGLLAELQFQLSQFFWIMGEEGYLLHTEIASNMASSEESGLLPHHTKSAGDIISILSSPFMKDIWQPKSEASNVTIESESVHTTGFNSNLGFANDSKPNPAGNIGLAGAAAADAKKSLMKSNANDLSQARSKPNPFAGGGIAAAAAAAAASKSQKKDSSEAGSEVSSRPNPFAGGGIAAATAAAAASKAQKKDSSEVGAQSESKPNPFAGGGIAAAAAAAAASKSENKKDASGASSDSKPNPLAGGGIAAAAAAAAATKSQKKDSSSTSSKSKPNPFAGGGIAAAAAAAAAAKSQQKNDNNEASSQSESKPNPFAGGGIAAAAAAAAAAKSQKKDNGNKGVLGGSSTRRYNGSFEEEKKSDTLSVNLISSMSSDQKNAQNHTDNKLQSMKKLSSEGGKSDTRVGQATKNQMLTVFNAGLEDAMANPRDLASFCCLYLLATKIRETSYGERTNDGRAQTKSIIDEHELSTVSEKFLLRSLAIGNQATSIGMVGWLEYGSSNPLDRTASILFDVQHKMACFLAEQNDWSKTVGVLSALVLRCRRQLTPFHPKTLCAMLDLGGALGEIGDQLSAALVLQRVQDAVKSLLSAFETLHFDHLSQNVDLDSHYQNVIVNDDGMDAIQVLRQFAVGFQRELSRDFLDCLGPGHSTVLWSHSLTADALSVLSNCLRMNEDGTQQNVDVGQEDVGGSAYYSTLAYRHYKIAFSGWTKKEGLSGINTASAALSLSRQLREMDKLSQALKILEAVASCFEKEVDALIKRHESTPRKSTISRKSGFVTTQPEGSLESHIQSEVVHFLPITASNRMPSLLSQSRRGSRLVTSIGTTCQREQLSVACLWMMAVLTMEQSGDDERGRYRALSLLHTASLSMKRVLQDDGLDDDTRTVCLDMYRCIDDEARSLFEPVNELVVPSNDKALLSKQDTTGQKTVEFRIFDTMIN